MPVETLSFQKHTGYNDQEMEIFQSDPEKVMMVTQTPEFVKCEVIAVGIESHGCHAGHRKGDVYKFIN
jgi:tetraacyldisaccharide-1-P 4'-kinase